MTKYRYVAIGPNLVLNLVGAHIKTFMETAVANDIAPLRIKDRSNQLLDSLAQLAEFDPKDLSKLRVVSPKIRLEATSNAAQELLDNYFDQIKTALSQDLEDWLKECRPPITEGLKMQSMDEGWRVEWVEKRIVEGVDEKLDSQFSELFNELLPRLIERLEAHLDKELSKFNAACSYAERDT